MSYKGDREVKRVMWISRKTIGEINKKIADLESKLQSQQEIMKEHMGDHECSVNELKNIISSLKNHVNGEQQTS